MSLVLPPGFGAVCATALGSFAVHTVYMGQGVMAARKKFNVKYPALYATPDIIKDEQARNAYNCVQRAHQNSVAENLPMFHLLLVLAGLRHPVTASLAGWVYLLGRVLYFRGYATGEPSKRQQGSIGYLGLLTLLGIVAKTAWELRPTF